MTFAKVLPPSGYLAPSKCLGSLVVLAPYRFDRAIQHFGDTKDVVTCGAWILQGEGAGSEYASAQISNVKLVSQLSNLVGQYTLGRFAEGPATSGGKKPVILAPPSEEDIRVATLWLERGGKNKIETILAIGKKEAEAPASSADGSAWDSALPPAPPVTAGATPPF